MSSPFKSGTQTHERSKAKGGARKEDFHFNIALSSEKAPLLFFTEKVVVTITVI